MILKHSSAAVASAAILGLGFAPQTLAQDDEGLFEEITVTATKREQSIYEVPMSISAFSGDVIEAQGVTDLVDVGKFVPNLNVTTFSAGHTSSANPFIRGIGLQDHLITTDPGVSVYVDGVYLGRQVGQNWSLSNIERIEVLRGPQGTLYGRNSIGGAINIITKTPGEEEGARIAGRIGSRGRLNADFYGDTRLDDQWAASFTGGFKKRDGIGTFLNLPNAKADVGETKDIFARLAVLWTPNDDFSLTIAADGNNGDNGLNPYTTLIDEVPGSVIPTLMPPLNVSNADISADPYDNNTGQQQQVTVTNEAQGLAITADWALSDQLATRLIASRRHSEYKAGLDDDSAFEDTLSFPEIGEADQTSIELQLNGDYGAFDFVSGIYWFKEDGTNLQDGYSFINFNRADGFFFLDQSVTSTAIFGNVGYNVSDQFRVAAGLRFNRDKKDGIADVGIGPTPGNRTWNETSWDVSANFTMNNGINLYGAVQSGYQSGQFPARPFCLFGDPNCFVAGDNITATNFEFGVKGQVMDNLSVSAAIFVTDYKDLPYQVSTTDPLGGGFNTNNLIVEQRSIGFEWENTMYVTDNFLFHLTLGFIDVDVDEQTVPAPDPMDPPVVVKPVAPLTPELTFAFSPVYSMPLALGATLTFRADFSHRDNMWGEPTDDPGRLTAIDSRSLINLDVAWESPDSTWLIALYGHNVTDERYDNARLNTGDYILRILSNDASEWGVRFAKNFD